MVGITREPSSVFSQDVTCIMTVYDTPVVYIVDLDFVSETFSNDADCVQLDCEQDDFKCSRDIDTLENITGPASVSVFDRIWIQGLDTMLANNSISFEFRSM
jgi:hypothetical protein